MIPAPRRCDDTSLFVPVDSAGAATASTSTAKSPRTNALSPAKETPSKRVVGPSRLACTRRRSEGIRLRVPKRVNASLAS